MCDTNANMSVIDLLMTEKYSALVDERWLEPGQKLFVPAPEKIDPDVLVRYGNAVERIQATTLEVFDALNLSPTEIKL